MQIRKQENNIGIDDLIQFPVWEYALDEEGVLGQNEKTLRPYLFHPPLDRDKAYFLVRARFNLANGIKMVGFVKPLKQGEDKLIQPLLPYDLNPVIVTAHGQVAFCYGTFKPDESVLLENYKRLGYGPESLFPIVFNADIEVRNSVTNGVLQGFLFFEQNTRDFFKLKSSDIRSVK